MLSWTVSESGVILTEAFLLQPAGALVPVMSISFNPAQFQSDVSPEVARALFKQFVRFVEIETFTFCNRKCWFCPNSGMPSRQDRAGNRYMDETLYLRILGDLRSIEYDGQIQFGRYNEPLADRIILTRIRQAREHCPKAFLYTHTNGDYLTREYLEELSSAGLNAIRLQTYLGNNDRYDDARMQARQKQQLEKLGLRIARTLVSVVEYRHYHLTDYPKLQLTIDARNFDRIGIDRGGLVQVNVPKAERTAPCMAPFKSLYIDWTGDTVPCCNIRSDAPMHQKYIVSRLQEGAGVFDAYVALYAWRKGLLRFGPKAAPCNTCNHETKSVPPEAAGWLDALYQQLVSAEG